MEFFWFSILGSIFAIFITSTYFVFAKKFRSIFSPRVTEPFDRRQHQRRRREVRIDFKDRRQIIDRRRIGVALE